MQITAAVLDRIGHASPFADPPPLRLAALDLAPPGPDELLVRIDAAGLCHSDLSVINGDRPRPMPMALGHEAAATVLEAGGNAAGFAPGDRVVLTFLPMCGECVRCRSGEGWLCAAGAAANGAGTLMGGARRLSENGCPVHHHLGCSAFATHAVVDRRSAVKVPADVPPEIAALFGCAVLTGVGAVLNAGALRPGESVAIVGMGGVGAAALLGALAGGAATVTAIDPVPAKRELALSLGASAAFDPADPVAGDKPDLVIETAGKGAALAAAYALARRGGRIVSVGLPNPAEPLTINALSLVADAKTLIGSYLGNAVPRRDIPRYIALWRAGRLPVERLLTSVSPLAEINTLFDRLAAGEAVRQVVVPNAS